MKIIDNFLNQITMYRLVLWELIILIGLGAVFSFLNLLPFDGILLLFSAAFLVAVSGITNYIFAKVYKIVPNGESIYISALILGLVLPPITSVKDIIFLFWAAVLTAASKFIFSINYKHIFNPVAISLVVTSLALNQSASWWVGTGVMAPFVLIGGILIVRKIRRFDMVFYFFLLSFATIFLFTFLHQGDILSTFLKTITSSSLLFFAFIMLTEPLTTPPTKRLQSIYGALVGILFAPQFHLGGFYPTPEIALCLGNIYSYVVSPKQNLNLKLQQTIPLSSQIYDFVFKTEKKFNYLPGQYMEWTLGDFHSDSRGNRRYFTLASSPTEDMLRIGVKFYPNSSSFKKKMMEMSNNFPIRAGNLAGDFTLPRMKGRKMVFIAGGIGITPFRSMLKYLIDTNQKENIILFYAVNQVEDFVYQDVLGQASKKLGVQTIFTITQKGNIPPSWQGEAGYIDDKMLLKYVPDFKERLFYVSGPLTMISSFKATLARIGVKDQSVVTDYFPGFA